MARILGAHSVSNRQLWNIARVRGVSASFLALFLGCWILYHQHALFRTPAWEELYWAVGGNIAWIGWPILIGGVLGVAGLVFRASVLSVLNCVICLIWFAWLLAFAGYANFTDSPNAVMWFGIYGLLEYVYRLVLLAFPPKPGEEYGPGW